MLFLSQSFSAVATLVYIAFVVLVWSAGFLTGHILNLWNKLPRIAQNIPNVPQAHVVSNPSFGTGRPAVTFYSAPRRIPVQPACELCPFHQENHPVALPADLSSLVFVATVSAECLPLTNEGSNVVRTVVNVQPAGEVIHQECVSGIRPVESAPALESVRPATAPVVPEPCPLDRMADDGCPWHDDSPAPRSQVIPSADPIWDAVLWDVEMSKRVRPAKAGKPRKEKVTVVANPPVAAEDSEEALMADVGRLMGMTVPLLKAEAKTRGIALPRTARRKEDIVACLLTGGME